MSLGLQCGWPSMGISNGASSMSTRNALGTNVDLTRAATNNFSNVDCSSQPTRLSSQTPQAFNQQLSSVLHTSQYSPHPHFSPSKHQMARVNNFMNPSTNLAFNSAQPQRCPSFSNNTRYHSNVSLAAASQIDSAKLQEWQEGFRALLPNINVRFVPDFSAAGLPFLHLQYLGVPYRVYFIYDHCSYHCMGMNSFCGSGFSSLKPLDKVVAGYPPGRTSPMEMQRTANQFSSTPNYDQTMPISAQLLNPMTSPAPPSVPSMNSYSHPTQQWMMPPPGFSYVSKR